VALVEHLQSAGHEAEVLAPISIGTLRSLVTDPVGRAMVDRYLDRRSVVGTVTDGSPAFVDEHGEPVLAEGFGRHMRALRRVAVNVEFNGALCRGLLAARFDERGDKDREPSLLDFIHALPAEKRSSL
ncbi:MAG TPA: hypothetical protein VHX12_07715, partial [Acidisoma sp.]|nr:hypothetical protein [Acidisoma sp.]